MTGARKLPEVSTDAAPLKLPALAAQEVRGLAQALPLFEVLMPMFLWLDSTARIRGVGRTLRKTIGEADVIGQPFSRIFVIGRRDDETGQCSSEMRSVCGHTGCSRQIASCQRVIEVLTRSRAPHLTLRSCPGIDLRGETVPLGAAEGGGLLMNLSFGIYLREAVSLLNLTEHDFSGADLAMEMLYLQEAKSLVMGELRALTSRLDTARREAETLALTDPLTRLANRRAMERALSKAVHGALRAEGQIRAGFGLMQIDLDHFKAVNDTQGHAAGDYVLQSVARDLRETVRNGDLVGRIGGDEFQVLLHGPVERTRMAALARRIIARLEQPKWYSGRECLISGSIGVALSQDYAEINLETMQGDVDRATYAAKEAGRGCVRFSVRQAR